MISLRTRILVMIAFAAFSLCYMTLMLRWHTYRAKASVYARQEVEHTFEAANYARAARHPGDSAESRTRAASCRQFAEMHEKAALECGRLRSYYEGLW